MSSSSIYDDNEIQKEEIQEEEIQEEEIQEEEIQEEEIFDSKYIYAIQKNDIILGWVKTYMSAKSYINSLVIPILSKDIDIKRHTDIYTTYLFRRNTNFLFSNDIIDTCYHIIPIEYLSSNSALYC